MIILDLTVHSLLLRFRKSYLAAVVQLAKYTSIIWYILLREGTAGGFPACLCICARG